MDPNVYTRKEEEPRPTPRPSGALELVGTAARIRDDKTGEDELYLNRAQAEALVRLVRGSLARGEKLPLCDNHRTDMPVGNVLAMWINEDDDVRAHVRANEDELGGQASDLVRAGLYRGLSLHLKYLLQQKPVTGPDGKPLFKKVGAEFIELSVCPQGADEHAVITAAASLGIAEGGGREPTLPFKADSMSDTESAPPQQPTEAPPADLMAQFEAMRREQAELRQRLEAAEKERATAEKRQAKAEAEQKKIAHEAERDRRFAKWRPDLEKAEAACRELAGNRKESTFGRDAGVYRALLEDPEKLMAEGAEDQLKERLDQLSEMHSLWTKQREATKAAAAPPAAPAIDAAASGGGNFAQRNEQMKQLSGAAEPQSATPEGFEQRAAAVKEQQQQAMEQVSAPFRWSSIQPAQAPTQQAPAQQPAQQQAPTEHLVPLDVFGMFALEAAASSGARLDTEAEMFVRRKHMERRQAASRPMNPEQLWRATARRIYAERGPLSDRDRVITPREFEHLKSRPANSVQQWRQRVGQTITTSGMRTLIGSPDDFSGGLVLYGGRN